MIVLGWLSAGVAFAATEPCTWSTPAYHGIALSIAPAEGIELDLYGSDLTTSSFGVELQTGPDGATRVTASDETTTVFGQLTTPGVLQPQRPVWFGPTVVTTRWATVGVSRAAGGRATIEALVEASYRPVAPLRAEVACSDLGFAVGSWDARALIDAPPGTPMWLASDESIALRASPHGRVLGTLRDAGEAEVLGTYGRSSRVYVDLYGYGIVGFVPTSALVEPPRRGYGRGSGTSRPLSATHLCPNTDLFVLDAQGVAHPIGVLHAGARVAVHGDGAYRPVALPDAQWLHGELAITALAAEQCTALPKSD